MFTLYKRWHSFKMRTSILTFTLLLFFIVSCREQTQNSTINDKNESFDIEKIEFEIISQTLFELVEFKSVRNPPLVQDITETEKEFKKRQEAEHQEFKRELKKNGRSFYLLDTLFIPMKHLLPSIPDTAYNGLAIQLLSDTLEPKPIDISKIAKTDSITFLDYRPSLNNIEIGYCGYAAYSRIIFNDDFDIAFFYFYQDCGYGLCGSGHFIVVEKDKEIWTITRNDQIWIS